MAVVLRSRRSPKRTALVGLLGLSLGGLALFALGNVSCKGNHSALAPGPDGGGAGPASASASKAVSSSSGSASTSGAGGAPSEPDGPTRFTFVNGVVDAPSVTYCFVPYPSGTSTRSPFPTSGLAFGHAYVAPSGSADIPSTDSNVLAIAGTIPSGTTCGDIATNPTMFPELTAVDLGVLPASALSMRRSFLFITDGCFGGAGHASSLDPKVCGTAYTSDTPNPGLSVLAMSRITNPAHVGFQYVNAVASATKLSASLQPSGAGAASKLIADMVPLGAALPYPPNFALGASDIGAVSGAALLNRTPEAAMATNVPLAQALSGSGLSAADVTNGKDIVLVGVGATPGTPSGSWWNDFTVVAVANDPP